MTKESYIYMAGVLRVSARTEQVSGSSGPRAQNSMMAYWKEVFEGGRAAAKLCRAADATQHLTAEPTSLTEDSMQPECHQLLPRGAFNVS